MVIFDISPIPNRRMNTGNRASGAVLRQIFDELIEQIAEPAVPADHYSQRNHQYDGDQKPAQGAQQAGCHTSAAT
jgi:hypothetical protein